MECWKRWGWRRFRSKYLKAVAVNGHGCVPIAREDEFVKMAKELTEKSVLTEANIWAKTDGTPVIVDMSNNVGIEDFEQSPNSTLFAGTSVLTPYQLRTRLHL